MADLLASFLLFLATASLLGWTLARRRTVGRDLWRPSIGRNEHPGRYWSEVAWLALFTLVALGMVLHFAAA